MFTFDDRIKSIPAGRGQVVALHQSINSPNVAVPGKQAGPAQAFVVGLKGRGGLAVLVYLALSEGAECAAYVPDRREVSPDEYGHQEAEAMAFVESMGFMMDNLNFRGLSAEDQDRLLRTLPVFQKAPAAPAAPAAVEPGAAGKAAEEKVASPSALGRLFGSF